MLAHCGNVVGPLWELWAHCGETVGKWNEIDKQMQKHTHKVASIKANEYVIVGQHSTIYSDDVLLISTIVLYSVETFLSITLGATFS